MKDDTVMLIGAGDLGGIVLEFLARETAVGRIVVAGRDVEKGEARCNLARVSAIAQGYSPTIEFVRLDIDEPESVAAAVGASAPQVIHTTANMHTWWIPNLLPPDAAALIRSAGFGSWLPVHLTPTMKLMRTLKAIDFAGHVLTAPFPDLVNPILHRLGLAPTCGIGNVDLVVPKIRHLAAHRLEVGAHDVRIQLVAHHALMSPAYRNPGAELPPYFLRIFHEGRDVTAEVEAEKLVVAPYPLPGGQSSHFLSAGSSAGLILAFLGEEVSHTHAPAPHGLPGGYPVLVSRKGIELEPVEGLSLEQAISINERSHRFDNIERIEDDGTAVFTADSVAAFREILGYDCDRLAPDESEDRAVELIARYREFARRHGVNE
ncbi:MAG: saccharopine dehydrogenase NADP-binding domain-containing protein [Phycisphaerales bacterium]|nr:MAG: saccharopine dehydrogenase NADP-binding domain-containing protein [Phycisphaerales bacterium]